MDFETHTGSTTGRTAGRTAAAVTRVVTLELIDSTTYANGVQYQVLRTQR